MADFRCKSFSIRAIPILYIMFDFRVVFQLELDVLIK
ncbi:unnamed protein product [Paramecium pentaurelia]|uniref:Uncharacterized protein n=1 Tax=Paramecium pentaurelia TaxID=43138 RepID=A0A8S1WHW4_9CILI|nr:unnamed protein product [Paramecium pentaurelia]